MVQLWWIGTASADRLALEEVRVQLERAFRGPVVLRPNVGRPEGTLDPRRGQHASARILHWLVERRPPAVAKVLAVTDADLFMPVLTFVYGEAQLGGVAAVVSTARLAEDTGAAGGRLRARLAKECIHELGHTFGLLHCGSPGCAMSRSANLLDVDAKEAGLCADCRGYLREQRRPEDGSEA
jgi:archaemetzincin